MIGTNAFDTAFKHTVGIEGGYSDHPSDTGGETRFGITERVARANGYGGAMRALLFATAKRIYKTQYWNPLRLDEVGELSPAIAAELFDTGVNIGIGRATAFLQRALNVLNKSGTLFSDIQTDGAMGPITLGALTSFLSVRGKDGEIVMLRALNAQQAVKYIEFAESKESQEDFLFGWLKQRVG